MFDKFAPKPKPLIGDEEGLCDLKKVTALADLGEPEINSPAAQGLKCLYDLEERAKPIEKSRISVMNSIFTQKRVFFTITQRSLRALLKADKNWTHPKGFKNQNYSYILKFLMMEPALMRLAQAGKGLMPAVYQLVDEEMLKALNLTTEEKESQKLECFTFVEKKAGVFSKPSESATSPELLPGSARESKSESHWEASIEDKAIKNKVLEDTAIKHKVLEGKVIQCSAVNPSDSSVPFDEVVRVQELNSNENHRSGFHFSSHSSCSSNAGIDEERLFDVVSSRSETMEETPKVLAFGNSPVVHEAEFNTFRSKGLNAIANTLGRTFELWTAIELLGEVKSCGLTLSTESERGEVIKTIRESNRKEIDACHNEYLEALEEGRTGCTSVPCAVDELVKLVPPVSPQITYRTEMANLVLRELFRLAYRHTSEIQNMLPLTKFAERYGRFWASEQLFISWTDFLILQTDHLAALSEGYRLAYQVPGSMPTRAARFNSIKHVGVSAQDETS